MPDALPLIWWATREFQPILKHVAAEPCPDLPRGTEALILQDAGHGGCWWLSWVPLWKQTPEEELLWQDHALPQRIAPIRWLLWEDRGQRSAPSFKTDNWGAISAQRSQQQLQCIPVFPLPRHSFKASYPQTLPQFISPKAWPKTMIYKNTLRHPPTPAF